MDHLLSKEIGLYKPIGETLDSFVIARGYPEAIQRIPVKQSKSPHKQLTVFSSIQFPDLLIFDKWQLEIKENYNVYRDLRGNKYFLLSVYGRTMDALASGGYEGRGRLR